MLTITQPVIGITTARNYTAHPLKMNAGNDLKVDILTTAIKNPINLRNKTKTKPPPKKKPKTKTKTKTKPQKGEIRSFSINLFKSY